MPHRVMVVRRVAINQKWPDDFCPRVDRADVADAAAVMTRAPVVEQRRRRRRVEHVGVERRVAMRGEFVFRGPPLKYSTDGLTSQMPTCLSLLDQPHARTSNWFAD